MKRKNIFVAAIVIIILISLTIIGVIRKNTAYENLKKDGTVVVATVISSSGGRGAFEIHVQYQYNGKTILNSIGTYRPDTLKTNRKIWLLISEQHPEGYVYSLGLVK